MDHAVAIAVEALRHEVCPAVFMQQPGRRSHDAGFVSHEMVGVFDAAISLRVSQLAISAQAIELEQPVLEARSNVKLSGTDFVRVRIPGNSCFCPGAAGGSTDR